MLPVVGRYLSIWDGVARLHNGPLPLFISCLVHCILNLLFFLIVSYSRSPVCSLCC